MSGALYFARVACIKNVFAGLIVLVTVKGNAMKFSRISIYAICTLASSLLIACGGGSGGSAPATSTTGSTTAETLSISGTVTGLASGQQITLENNGANATVVNSNSTFTFSTPIANNGSYDVTISTKPYGKTCAVTNGTNSAVTANVTNVSVACSPSTVSVLYSFVGGTNIKFPSYALIQGSDGNFYGTSNAGGASGFGGVFKLTPAGVETLLYSFAGGTDGSNPMGSLVEGTDGNFYGTTNAGGTSGDGTVYKVTPAGVETVLYSFAGGADGSGPRAGLIIGTDGNFYGTTTVGGTPTYGTIYKITPAGVETVLYSFAGPPEGAYPDAPLTQGTDGNFYGTTYQGGASSNGTVFKVTPAGVETLLHTFTANPDGSGPNALTLGNDGNFYGNTNQGGSNGVGSVFKITPAGVETVLYSFSGGTTDAADPLSALVLANDGNFYGTSYSGGIDGTVYMVTPAGVESVLHTFSVTANGTQPQAGITIGTDGFLYGLTLYNGTNNDGVFFRL